MSYIGSTPTSQNFISGTDYFNGTGSQTAFTLTRSVNSVNDVEVVVNNVIQQPNSYTVSGTTLTLSAAPSSGTSNVYVRYLATNQQSFTVGNNTVGYNQLTSDMQSKFAMKNRIINGAMVIDQRYAGASKTITNTGDVTYVLDRWLGYGSQASKFSIQQNAGSVTPPAGFTNYLGVTSLAATTIASTDAFVLNQYIEGYNFSDSAFGTADAKSITVSFWVRSSLTGTFAFSVCNNDSTTTFVSTYAINSANTWEYKTVTISGATAGNWLKTNGVGLQLRFDLGSGSNFNGTAGSWIGTNSLRTSGSQTLLATNGATFYITGVQLEVGTSATGFEYRQYQQELAFCQRYYEKSYDIGVVPGTGGQYGGLTLFRASSQSGASAGNSVSFKVSKRASPTIAFYTAIDGTSGNLTYTRNGVGATSATANATAGMNQFYIDVGVGAAWTNCEVYGQWTASAEL